MSCAFISGVTPLPGVRGAFQLYIYSCANLQDSPIRFIPYVLESIYNYFQSALNHKLTVRQRPSSQTSK
jgi:hypothetical protein